jgi:FixJ family two-component response regulator
MTSRHYFGLFLLAAVAVAAGLSKSKGEVRRLVSDQEVLLVAQKSDVGAAVAALRAGASDYLLKPVDEAELLQRVSRAIERAALRREGDGIPSTKGVL